MVAGPVPGNHRPNRCCADAGSKIRDERARLELERLPVEYETASDFLTRVGLRSMARLRAEEIVLRDALPAPDELPREWQTPTAQETAACIIADEGDAPRTRTQR